MRAMARVVVRLFMVVATSAAGLEATARQLSPGLHDVVVYDAAAHEQGLPGVGFRKTGDGLKVDVPPAVHVHRYYYSGNKEIQGPIVTGGPTIIVAKHPTTGQQMYIDVVLPAGTPRIAYHKSRITYVYPDQRIAVQFKNHDPSTAIVKYHKGRGVARVAHDFGDKSKQRISQATRESRLVKSVKDTADLANDLASGTTAAAGDLAATGLDFIQSTISGLPGISTIRSLADQIPKERYLNSIDQASARGQQQAESFLQTNR